MNQADGRMDGWRMTVAKIQRKNLMTGIDIDGREVFNVGMMITEVCMDEVIGFMAEHDMSADVYESMVDHDAFDGGIMRGLVRWHDQATMAMRAGIGLSNAEYDEYVRSIYY